MSRQENKYDIDNKHGTNESMSATENINNKQGISTGNNGKTAADNKQDIKKAASAEQSAEQNKNSKMKKTGIAATVKKVVKSLYFQSFVTTLLVGIIIAAVIFTVAHIACETGTLTKRENDIREYVIRTSTKIVNNNYIQNPGAQPDITKELDIVSEAYDARIILTDSRLKVIYDSNRIESGKTLLSAETVNALRGKETLIRDKSGRKGEFSMPIGYSAGQSKADGVLTMDYSLNDSYQTVKELDNRLTVAVVILGIMLIIGCVWGSRRLTRPFKQIVQSIRHISDGYTRDEVNFTGFTEITKVSDSFNEMLDRIQRLEDSRQEFVSNVSHELKTPITSIKVLSDSLLAQPEAPIELYREFMVDINEEIDRESKIISDLLALIKLDRKTGDMHLALVSINEMLEILLRRLKPIAQTAGVELILESYREVTAEVDEVKLTLAISNLIENAIKYNNPNGWVKISLNCDHRCFIVVVADSGIGIAESELEHIFERFYRVDKMRSRETGGTGLGLSITKNVVLMHSGTIKVESVEGQGTSFTMRIPLNYIKEGGF